jgi:hypothetical protein
VNYCTIKNIQLRSQPGSKTLFGCPSASGLRHEVDVGLVAMEGRLFLELKAYSEDIPKNEVMIFNEKSLDYFLSFVLYRDFKPFYRILVSHTPISPEVRKFCYLWKIITVDPDLLPIPTILRVITNDDADEYFDDLTIREGERILSPLVKPLDGLLKLCTIENKEVMLMDIKSILTTSELDDAVEAHEELSDVILKIVEDNNPGYFENLAYKFTDKI